jgi:hypothetical protein
MRSIARLLSVLLHPVWMLTWVLAVCFHVDPWLTIGFAPEGKWLLLGTVFVMTALFPLTSTLMMRRSGLVSGLELPSPQERIPVYILTLIYYCLCYYLMWRVPNDPLTMSVILGAGLSLFFTLVITFWWKISLHMVGMGGLVGALLAMTVLHEVVIPFWISGAFVLTGALASARLFESDHTPAQVYTGALLGCACVYGCAAFGIWI